MLNNVLNNQTDIAVLEDFLNNNVEIIKSVLHNNNDVAIDVLRNSDVVLFVDVL